MTITVERNLKVVHPYWSKTNLNHWMIYAAMVFAWIAGTLSIAPIIVHLDSSLCWGRNVPDIFLVGKYKIQDDIPLLDHLLVLTSSRGRVCFLLQSHSGRHEKTGARDGAAHNVDGSAQMSDSQVQSKRIKWNIIKTMIIVNVSWWFTILIFTSK